MLFIYSDNILLNLFTEPGQIDILIERYLDVCKFDYNSGFLPQNNDFNHRKYNYTAAFFAISGYLFYYNANTPALNNMKNYFQRKIGKRLRKKIIKVTIIDVDNSQNKEFPQKILDFIQEFIINHKPFGYTNIYFKAVQLAYTLSKLSKNNVFQKIKIDKTEYVIKEIDFRVYNVEQYLKDQEYGLHQTMMFQNFNFVFENQKYFLKYTKNLEFSKGKKKEPKNNLKEFSENLNFQNKDLTIINFLIHLKYFYESFHTKLENNSIVQTLKWE